MIQRIQSVYIVIVITAIAMMFNFALLKTTAPSLSAIGEDKPIFQYEFSTLGIYETNELGEEVKLEPSILLMILIGLSLLVAVLTLFWYKDRPVQMRLCSAITFLVIISMLVAYFEITGHKAYGTSIDKEPGIAAAMPLVVIIFSFLASRAITKDEELVRSADRIR